MSQSSHNTANYPSLLVYTATMHTKKKELILSSIFAWSYFFQVFNGLGYLFQYLILGLPGSFPLFGAKNKTQSQLSCRLNFSLNCSLVFPILSALCTLFPRASSLSCHFCIPSFPTNFITS